MGLSTRTSGKASHAAFLSAHDPAWRAVLDRWHGERVQTPEGHLHEGLTGGWTAYHFDDDWLPEGELLVSPEMPVLRLNFTLGHVGWAAELTPGQSQWTVHVVEQGPTENDPTGYWLLGNQEALSRLETDLGLRLNVQVGIWIDWHSG